jgi:Plasmid pRiA4b ORF-3-like protein
VKRDGAKGKRNPAGVGRAPTIRGIWQLKVTLRESNPPIWRRVLVPGSTTLRRLHLILQDVMGWTNSHLHLFEVGAVRYGDPDPEWEMEVRDESKTQLSQIAPAPKSELVYEYDMGDSWTHDIVVEEILVPDAAMLYPICLDGQRACPPEDCGGIGGYENLLVVLGNPEHEEYESTITWLGGRFDPEGFDVNAVNRSLSSRRPARPT